MDHWSWLAENWVLTTWGLYPHYGIMHNCKIGLKCPDSLDVVDLRHDDLEYEKWPHSIYPHISRKELEQLSYGGDKATNICLSCGEEIPKALAFIVGMMEAGYGT